MNKQEFESRVGKEVSQEQYDIIEFVYTWHPAISDYDGTLPELMPAKDQIAELYTKYGFGIIKDMKGTAEAMKAMEDEERQLQLEFERLNEATNKTWKLLVAVRNCRQGLRDEYRIGEE